MTACRDCVYFAKQSDIWHGQYCEEPAVRLPKRFSPEHGEKIEEAEPRPHVREINDGNCRYFSLITGAQEATR